MKRSFLGRHVILLSLLLEPLKRIKLRLRFCYRMILMTVMEKVSNDALRRKHIESYFCATHLWQEALVFDPF